MSPAVLVTIPTSHYCEKARWALSRAGIAFEERGHLPFFSRVATWRHGRWSSVPLLKTKDQLLTDSTEILRWVDAQGPAERRLFPGDAARLARVEELETRFDEGLGRTGRILLLSHVLPHRRVVLKLARAGVPLFEWIGLAASLPLARVGMKRMYGITEASVLESRSKIADEMAFVSGLLADGRRYLTGDRFTAADLTFASLAALVVLPPGGLGLPALEDLPPEGRADIERFRATPAGAFALRLYAEERGAA